MNIPNPASPRGSLVGVLGVRSLSRLLGECLAQHAKADEVHRATMDQVFVDFVTGHPLFTALALQQEPLVRDAPALAARLIDRAYARATTERQRELLRADAVRLGLQAPRQLSLFAPEPCGCRVVRTASQARIAEQLRRFARLSFAPPPSLGVKLRLNPLLIGPSGVGKTELVRQLGADLGIPVLKFTVGDWVPLGARNGTPTLQVLRQALDQEQQLVLHLDELEKFGCGIETSTWVASVMTEMFGILDRRPDGDWKPEQADRLQRNVLMVGSGTWQNLWDKGEAKIGFGARSGAADLAERVRAARVIPAELLNRFNADWQVIEPYTAEDFVQLVEALGLPPDLIDPDEAAESRLNFRYVENAVTAEALKTADAASLEAR